MHPIEPLNLSATQWQFLSNPERYCDESIERKLVLASTKRQFNTARDILERLNGSCGQTVRRGILLADDVGLGKTTVAALVAWVIASAGEKRVVRILAPNDVMVRRWEEELKSHVEPLSICAPQFDANEKRVKTGKVSWLSAGSIQIAKHSSAVLILKNPCDLLIVDEAHRAKGEKTAFSDALKKHKKSAKRVLILTATPFSIQIDELNRMLNLIGGETAHVPVKKFSQALNNLYAGNTDQSPESAGKRLADKAQAAVEALSSFVIRHGIDDLPHEKSSFGIQENWRIDVPEASQEELELMLRMDRALRIAKKEGTESVRATNDPRFHVGWRHFDAEIERLKKDVPLLSAEVKPLVEKQITAIKPLRSIVGGHSKMKAVAQKVQQIIEHGEKVVLFCHHHATAQELTACIAAELPKVTVPRIPMQTVWKRAWNIVLNPASQDHRDEKLREIFIDWLCEDLIRAQTASWFRTAPTSEAILIQELNNTKARRLGAETISEAAQRLFHALLDSKSSRAVLREAERECRIGLIPGANGTSHALGVCEPSTIYGEGNLFIHNKQPDTIISIFNSPFGPDVLVVTDKLSEGIDLHRYCRHLIHYELDPSPIRTIQRNGRIRRVNSWSAVTGKPIRYAYPAFRGTRDHQLVQIMEKRINSFSLLLGGVPDIDLAQASESVENWRSDVIKAAQSKLKTTNASLRAKDYCSKNKS